MQVKYRESRLVRERDREGEGGGKRAGEPNWHEMTVCVCVCVCVCQTISANIRSAGRLLGTTQFIHYCIPLSIY